MYPKLFLLNLNVLFKLHVSKFKTGKVVTKNFITGKLEPSNFIAGKATQNENVENQKLGI